MGLRGMPEGELTFEDLEVPAGMARAAAVRFPARLCRPDERLQQPARRRRHRGDGHRGRRARAALDWVKTREQFGRPIGEFQGLQWMLADMQTQLTAARLMLYQAARSRGPDGSAFPDPMLAAQAKIFASESAIKIVNDALQMFGARGYSRDLPLERMARDVRMFTIGGGTAQVLRTLVASKMLGWKLPQTPRRLCPETLAARRGGVTMHPIFATAGESAGGADPVRHRRQFRPGDREGSTNASAPSCGRPASSPRPGGICWCRRPTAELAGVLFGLEDADDAGEGPVPAGRARRRCCRPAPIVSPMRRTMRGWRRSPLRSAPISSPATARPRRATCGWSCRTASTARTSRASPRASRFARDLINTPSNDMGPAELEDAARALAKQHGAKIQRHRRRRRWRKNFPLDPRGRRGLGARAAADRPHLGQRRAIRRSRWSARASASTPAGSTSSPTPACST